MINENSYSYCTIFEFLYMYKSLEKIKQCYQHMLFEYNDIRFFYKIIDIEEIKYQLKFSNDINDTLIIFEYYKNTILTINKLLKENNRNDKLTYQTMEHELKSTIKRYKYFIKNISKKDKSTQIKISNKILDKFNYIIFFIRENDCPLCPLSNSFKYIKKEIYS